ncbi:very short patch repair endonuclease [Maridesulfovibrio sp. FT414]|uniref:very short patch repair endonuclease n=1 Tax=Maridesulfovibrio sp. FT414 TaxID=2979469 RepID=UPI003D807D55
MADTISPERRSWNMSRIKGKNTRPELLLRSLLHTEGFRFRLHDPKLPGKPDIVLKKHKAVIFVNGCYWHRHAGCAKTTTPKTRTLFWLNKFAETVARDKRKYRELEELGWKVIIVWECQLKNEPQITLSKVRNQLERN